MHTYIPYMHTCISYNTGKSAMPDIYTTPKGAPEGKCMYIRQSTITCVITNALQFQHHKICPNLKPTAQLAYIIAKQLLIMIMGGYFNIFIMFPNIPMTYPIVVHLIMGLYSHLYGILLRFLWPSVVMDFIK